MVDVIERVSDVGDLGAPGGSSDDEDDRKLPPIEEFLPSEEEEGKEEEEKEEEEQNGHGTDDSGLVYEEPNANEVRLRCVEAVSCLNEYRY